MKLGVSLVQWRKRSRLHDDNKSKKEYPEASQSILQKAKYEEKKFECKKIIPKILDFKKSLKIKGFLKLIKSSKKIIKTWQSNKTAIAVSGGPDSLALCFLISCLKI